MVLGLQANVCLDQFDAENGSTNFVLGSHATRHAPPPEFNAPGDPHFPAHSPEAVDQVECVAGSVIICACQWFKMSWFSSASHLFCFLAIPACSALTAS